MEQQQAMSDREYYEKMFRSMDESGDGYIDTKELIKAYVLQGASPTVCEMEAMMAEVDKDGNGKLDIDEFCNMMQLHCQVDQQKEVDALKDAFACFDTDCTGYISKKELKAVLKPIKKDLEKQEGCRINLDKYVDKLMKDFDANEDGNLQIEEFAEMLTKKFQFM